MKKKKVEEEIRAEKEGDGEDEGENEEGEEEDDENEEGEEEEEDENEEGEEESEKGDEKAEKRDGGKSGEFDENEDVEKVNFDELNKEEERKYEGLTYNELSEKNNQKSNLLLRINKAKELSIQKLSDLVKKLNEVISKNTKILYRKEDPVILEQLNKAVNIRQKDLMISKKINKTLKAQYKNLKKKLIYEQSKESIGKIENKLEELREKNRETKLQILKLKDKRLLQQKNMTEMSNKINLSNKMQVKTSEITSLNAQKHDYLVKINSTNKKSIENLIKEANKFYDCFCKYKEEVHMSNNRAQNKNNNSVVKKIEFWLSLIKDDLSGEPEEIFDRVERDESKFLKEINNKTQLNANYNGNSAVENSGGIFKTNVDLGGNGNFKGKRMNSSGNKNKCEMKIQGESGHDLHTINNKIPSSNSLKLAKSLSVSKSMLNKYTNSASTANSISSDEILGDYSSVSDKDYRELLLKKDEVLEMNSRLLGNLRDNKRIFEMKIRKIMFVINENESRLNNLKTFNRKLEAEIEILRQVDVEKFRKMKREGKKRRGDGGEKGGADGGGCGKEKGNERKINDGKQSELKDNQIDVQSKLPKIELDRSTRLKIIKEKYSKMEKEEKKNSLETVGNVSGLGEEDNNAESNNN